jgi:hypothetical protein
MNRHEQDLFENMLDVLRNQLLYLHQIEERLGNIEESVKKEKPKKQLLND